MLKDEYKVYEEKMSKSIASVSADFASVRAGRANASVLDRIMVDYYGSPTPNQQNATNTKPPHRSLQIPPKDTSPEKHHKTAHHIAGPHAAVAHPPVAQHGDHRRQHEQHRQHKEDAGTAALIHPRTVVGGKGRLALSAGQIGVEHRRSAQGTDLFTVSQLHAAFDTVHSYAPFPRQRWLLSTVTWRPSFRSTR